MYIAYVLQFIGQSISSPHGISSAENRKCQTDRILSSSFLCKNWELTTKISRSVSHVLRNAGSFFIEHCKDFIIQLPRWLKFPQSCRPTVHKCDPVGSPLVTYICIQWLLFQKKKTSLFFSMVEYFIGLLLHFKQSSSKFLIASKSGFLETLIHLQT